MCIRDRSAAACERFASSPSGFTRISDALGSPAAMTPCSGWSSRSSTTSPVHPASSPPRLRKSRTARAGCRPPRMTVFRSMHRATEGSIRRAQLSRMSRSLGPSTYRTNREDASGGDPTFDRRDARLGRRAPDAPDEEREPSFERSFERWRFGSLRNTSGWVPSRVMVGL